MPVRVAISQSVNLRSALLHSASENHFSDGFNRTDEGTSGSKSTLTACFSQSESTTFHDFIKMPMSKRPDPLLHSSATRSLVSFGMSSE